MLPLLILLSISTVHAADKKNVLFIMADDMRPEIGNGLSDVWIFSYSFNLHTLTLG